MPFQPDNPNRNRNFIILILGLVAVFAIIMASYVTLAISGQDTENFVRFLTILVVTLIPSALAAFRANAAAQNSQKTAEKTEQVAKHISSVEEKLNGSFEERVANASAEGTKQAIREVTDKDGRPPV